MALTASQRINLIAKITDRLAPETWGMIDLTLNQFGLPTTDEWNSSGSNSYVMQMVQSADDQTLIELAAHLGFDFEVSTTSYIEPAFWRKGMFRLFITHLATHKKWAGELQAALLRYGISGFVAHNDIEPTSEWQNQIETALSTCDALVALMHENFHDSKWTDQEIGFAMGRSVPVFSVRFGETPYGFIGKFQAFNGLALDPVSLAGELFVSYVKNKQTKKKMSEVLVSMFEQSNSFAEAKINISNLEKIEVWDASFATRIRKAVESNSQIDGSYGVPARVETLAKKWSAK